MQRIRRQLRQKVSAADIQKDLDKDLINGRRRRNIPIRFLNRRNDWDMMRTLADLPLAHHAAGGVVPVCTRKSMITSHVDNLLQRGVVDFGELHRNQSLISLDLAVPLSTLLRYAWEELSQEEQLHAMTLEASTPRGSRQWELEGWRRAQQRGAPVSARNYSGNLLVLESLRSPLACPSAAISETGMIPGSGGDIPGIPDTWCSLYRVHRFREMQREATPEELYRDMFSEELPEAPVIPEDTIPEVHDCGENADAEVHTSVSPAPAGENLVNAFGKTLSPDNDLNFTQQMMEAEDQSLRSVAVDDSVENTHANDSTLRGGQLSALDSHPLVDDKLDCHPLDDGDLNDDEEEYADATLKCERVCRDGSVRWGST